jgi:cytochrome c556
MMRKLMIATIGIALGSLATVSLAADFAKEIKARKAVMEVYAFIIGQLGAMAKGKRPYDSKAAQAAAADNLLAAANMNNSAMWPKGSDAGASGLEGKTRAKIEAWSTYPKVSEKHQALTDAAVKMAPVASNGLDAVKANLGAVGKDCKGYHKAFRAPKK